MQMQQAQQQKGELDQSVTEQVMSMLQQVVQASDLTSKQVDELIMDKEQRDKKEYESQIEEKGYKRGLKDGKVQSKEEEATPNEETSDVNEEEKKMLEEQLLSENAQMEEALNSQQIPDEVLEELLVLAQQDPEMFREILQNYPQLAEMLQQDMQNMNGGMINEDM